MTPDLKLARHFTVLDGAPYINLWQEAVWLNDMQRTDSNRWSRAVGRIRTARNPQLGSGTGGFSLHGLSSTKCVDVVKSARNLHTWVSNLVSGMTLLDGQDEGTEISSSRRICS